MQDVSETAPVLAVSPAHRPGRRYLALWCPWFSAERITRKRRREGESGSADTPPLVLVKAQSGGLRLAALGRAAYQIGLRTGMSLADARTRLPALAVEPMDLAADARLLRRLAAACERFTPLVGLDPPDGLVLDVTGCAHLFGGEAALAASLRAAFARAGMTARLCLAATPEAAHAMVRFGCGGAVADDDLAARIHALPVEALEASAEVTLALQRAGLTRVGDVAARPPALIAARFGMTVTTRLRQLVGAEESRITPLRPLPPCLAERHFVEPLADRAAIETVLRRLAGDIAAALERRECGGRRFVLSLFRADGAVRRLAIETGAPCRDAAVLMRLIGLRIDSLSDPLDPGFGYDAIRLGVVETEALAPGQDDFVEPVAEGLGVLALIERLGIRFGRDRVVRLAGRDTHDPARAGRMVSALDPLPDEVPWPTEDGAPPARPLTLFTPPQPVEALAEGMDGPPLRFRWRHGTHEVACAEGPERIAPEWWRVPAGAPVRDYYRVEDRAGRRLWLFCEGMQGGDPGLPRWFVHGLFA